MAYCIALKYKLVGSIDNLLPLVKVLFRSSITFLLTLSKISTDHNTLPVTLKAQNHYKMLIIQIDYIV